MASSEVEPASKIGPSMGHVGVGASQSHMNVPISQGSSRAHLLMVLAHHKHKVISMCLSLEAGSSRARLLMVLVLAPHKVISMCLCLNLKLKAQGSSRARLLRCGRHKVISIPGFLSLASFGLHLP